MANRKSLKKQINYIVECMYAELCFYSVAPNSNKEKIADALTKIIQLQEEYIKRISHVEPGNTKAFFKQLKNEFDTQVDLILKDFDSLRK